MTNGNLEKVTGMTSQVSHKASLAEPQNLQDMLPQLIFILIVGRLTKRAPRTNLKRVAFRLG